MATDAALLRRASAPAAHDAVASPAGEPRGVWRCYGWSHPAVSFGRNETTRGRFDPVSVESAGLHAVRRPTGGRALLHAREVTYSVAFPLARAWGWRAAYDGVNRILRDALTGLGVAATIVPHGATDALPPDGPLCFDGPGDGEIVVGDAKLVASAVWRERGAYLQHGSILLHDDQARLVDAACGRVPAPRGAAALSALLDSPSPLPQASRLSRIATGDDAIRDAVETALEARLAANGAVTAFNASASFETEVARFERQFAAPEWLWRR